MTDGQKDRLDALLNKILMGLCAIALSVGAWFFSNLNESMRELTLAVGSLRTQVAVMQRDTDCIDNLQEQVRKHVMLEAHPTMMARYKDLESRIDRLEGRLEGRLEERKSR